MLHVRVVSPQDLTPRLVAALAAEPGVHNLVVLPGMAHRPDGDAVQFDLLNESANPVLRQLRGLQRDSRGSVTVGEANVALAGPRNATRDPALRPSGADPGLGHGGGHDSGPTPPIRRASTSCSSSPG